MLLYDCPEKLLLCGSFHSFIFKIFFQKVIQSLYFPLPIFVSVIAIKPSLHLPCEVFFLSFFIDCFLAPLQTWLCNNVTTKLWPMGLLMWMSVKSLCSHGGQFLKTFTNTEGLTLLVVNCNPTTEFYVEFTRRNTGIQHSKVMNLCAGLDPSVFVWRVKSCMESLCHKNSFQKRFCVWVTAC